MGRLQDRIFPLTVGLITLAGCAALMWRMWRAPASDDVFIDLEKGEDGASPFGLWATLSWFLGLLVLSFFFGLIIALVFFLLAFFRFRAGLGWRWAAIYTASGIAFICALAAILGRDFPPGLLQSWFNLPWPLT